MKFNKIVAMMFMTAVLAGCASSEHRAPVYERAEAEKNAAMANRSPREKDWRPDSYIVQKGDTLFSIAFNYGFDYHELAESNGIQDPGVISVGQEIRLFPNRARTATSVAPAVVKPIEILLKDQPKLVKYPYSEAAMAQIDKVQEQTTPVATTVAKVESTAKPGTTTEDSADVGEEPALEWGLPTQGKLIGQF